MGFQRYRIEGTLTTKSPLHIGSGLDVEDRIGKKKKQEENIKVVAVIKDVLKHPYIPATALKGPLHHWALRFVTDRELIRDLFGTGEEGMERGGRVLFNDALLDAGNTTIPPLFQENGGDGNIPLYWNPDYMTYVMASTVLNRVTRTAEQNKLYHYEVVPPGVSFRVVIDGEDLSEQQLALLLLSLEQFKSPDGLTLGGITAHGFGEVNWTLQRVSGLRTEADLLSWLKDASEKDFVGFNGLPHIPDEKIQELRLQSGLEVPQSSDCLSLDIEILFDGPFMINDPSQAKESNEDQDGTDHVYLKNPQNKISLTSKSLHGAVRAQAERIVRTIASDRDVFKKACYIDGRDKDQMCKPIARIQELESLCLTCRLFGGNGWLSPVIFSDFSPVQNGEGYEFKQDFVAIDRFTGGAADEKKFDAHYRFAPRFAGTLKIDLNRIEAKHMGLLILVLRDLMEGDIPLGFGRSKGFGSCLARITEVRLPDPYCTWIEECLKRVDCLGGRDNLTSVDFPLNGDQPYVLQYLVETFYNEVKSNAIS